MKVSASFLSCNRVIPAIKELSFTDVDYIHVDFIDGKFVAGKKIPFRILKKISRVSTKRLDVHLMTNKLKKYIRKFVSLNCEYITFHIEVGRDIEKYIQMIQNYGVKCGLAINPNTSLEEIKPYLSMIDMVLVMSVTPGFGGQAFIPETVDKVKELRAYLKKKRLKVLVNIDGGINIDTVGEIKPYVDMVVAGSYITNSSDFQEKINNLRG